MSPWPNYPSKKTVDKSGVLFDSLYDSELPNMKGCAQWKIELQLFGKDSSVIVCWVCDPGKGEHNVPMEPTAHSNVKVAWDYQHPDLST